jgi:hypothetical protein
VIGPTWYRFQILNTGWLILWYADELHAIEMGQQWTTAIESLPFVRGVILSEHTVEEMKRGELLYAVNIFLRDGTREESLRRMQEIKVLADRIFSEVTIEFEWTPEESSNEQA